MIKNSRKPGQYVLENLPVFILLLTLLIIITLVLAFILMRSINDPDYVSYTEIKASKDDDPLEYIELPANIMDYMSGQNYEVLQGWVEDLKLEARKDFVDNLSDIINKARSDDPYAVVDAINAYRTVKLNKITDNPYEKQVVVTLRYVLGFFVFFAITLMFLAVFTLLMLRSRGKFKSGEIESKYLATDIVAVSLTETAVQKYLASIDGSKLNGLYDNIKGYFQGKRNY